jgi:hypothetical protein
MSCILNGFIDYVNEEGYYIIWASHFNITNDYKLFSLMAGVRYSEDTQGFEPLFLPKGLPEAEWLSNLQQLCFEINDGLANMQVDGYCTQSEASHWIQIGLTKTIDSQRIIDPDTHSHSWLTAAELDNIIDKYETKTLSVHKPLRAIAAAVEALGEHERGSRFVFWFRN